MQSAAAVLMMAMALSSLPKASHAAGLSTTPDKCISLRKGQMCFQNIQLQWNATQPDNYCLIVEDNIEPIECWKNSKSGSTTFAFGAAEPVSFSLVRETDLQTSIAQSTVDLVWVYKTKKRRRTSWRLF